MKHAKLSASGSGQWLTCTGSIKAQEDFPNTSSSAAEEGTCAHELAAICLESNKTPQSYIGQTLSDAPNVAVNLEMANYVEEYMNYIRAIAGELFIEVRVDFSEFVPDGFGTSDAVIYDEESRTIHVIDLKYGKGVEVSADNNSQGMLYGLGAYNDYSFLGDIDNIVIHIYQPRMGNICEWSISLTDLLLWGNDFVKPRAIECLTDTAPRTAGEKQCMWCRAKATCNTLQSHIELTIGTEFDNLELADIDATTNVSNIMNNKKLIEGWLKAVEGYIFNMLESGKTVKGYKLVTGKSTRKWSDEVEVEKLLRANKYKVSDIFNTKLITAPQAAKLLGKKFDIVTDYVIKPTGKPTLALESDKRDALNLNISDDFDELT